MAAVGNPFLLTVRMLLSYMDAGKPAMQRYGEAFMSDRRKEFSRRPKSGALTRRQFMKLAGVSAASGALSWPGVTLFAAQPGRKRIVLHGESQVTSLGYHNRRGAGHGAR